VLANEAWAKCHDGKLLFWQRFFDLRHQLCRVLLEVFEAGFAAQLHLLSVACEGVRLTVRAQFLAGNETSAERIRGRLGATRRQANEAQGGEKKSHGFELSRELKNDRRFSSGAAVLGLHSNYLPPLQQSLPHSLPFSLQQAAQLSLQHFLQASPPAKAEVPRIMAEAAIRVRIVFISLVSLMCLFNEWKCLLLVRQCSTTGRMPPDVCPRRRMSSGQLVKTDSSSREGGMISPPPGFT